jgi:hypothetical protein
MGFSLVLCRYFSGYFFKYSMSIRPFLFLFSLRSVYIRSPLTYFCNYGRYCLTISKMKIFSNFLIGDNYSFLYTCTTQALVPLKKIYAPSSSLLQGNYLPFSPSPLRLNIFRLFVILSLTQLYRYTPEIFLFSTATLKYTYRAPFRWIGHEYSANLALSTFQSLSRHRISKEIPGEISTENQKKPPFNYN